MIPKELDIGSAVAQPDRKTTSNEKKIIYAIFFTDVNDWAQAIKQEKQTTLTANWYTP